MTKHGGPLKQVRLIFEDLIRFSQMSFEELVAHYVEHPEDRLCQLPSPKPTGGHHPLSRESVRRIGDLSRRVADGTRDGHAFSHKQLQRELQRTFIERFPTRSDITQRSVARWLNDTAHSRRTTHTALRHYIPCVFVRTDAPLDLVVGEIRFLSTAQFLVEQSPAVLAHLRSQYHVTADSQVDIGQRMLEEIRTHFTPYPWVAEVSVPPCDEEVSRERAELGVRATLDVFRIFLDHRAADLRLSVEPAPALRVPKLSRGLDGFFRCTFTVEGEGPFVEKEWFEGIPEEVSGWLNLAGAAIRGILDPSELSSHRDRWLDALNWCGQALAERRPATALVKLVASMERLTTCSEDKREIAERVSRRTALLGHDEFGDVQRSAIQMKTVYAKRSRLMHGDARPNDPETPSLLATARELAKRALHGSLVLFWNLDRRGEGSKRDLERWYLTLEQNFFDFLHTGPSSPS